MLPDYFCPAQRGWGARATRPEVKQRSPQATPPPRPRPEGMLRQPGAQQKRHRRTGHSQAVPRPPRAGAATAGTCYEMATQRLRKPPGPAKETCLATQHIAGCRLQAPTAQTAKRQKPGMAGLLKQAPRRTGTQQTRWISAWRTGSRDGPCADRPSYARLRERHGS
ncbi:hypothetical protein FHT07_000662 [Xanthomonas arboricola]|nr:hypothetical protein [Xanthomonas arboricola]